MFQPVEMRTKSMSHKAKPRYRTRLAALRERMGMSRMDIVRGTKMAYATVMKWETQPLSSLDSENVSALLHLLGVSHEELVYLVEEEAKEQP